MKTHKLMGFLTAALTALGTFGLVGCSEAVAPVDEMPSALVNATIPALDAEPGVIIDATVDMPMALERPAGDKKRQHEDCAKAVRDALRASEQALMEPFKAQRDEVKAKVEAGEITKDEARALVREINAAAREALKSNPERAAAQAALQACRDAFIAGLRAVLTPDQIVVLDQWIADPGAFGHGKDGKGKGDKDGKGKGDKGPGHDDRGGKGRGGRGHHDDDSTGTGGGSDTTNTNPNVRG